LLTAQERRALERALGAYVAAGGAPRSAGIEALRVLQRYRGWITEESLQDLAGLLGLGVDELEGLATFYTRLFRRPVGRHRVWYCDSASCWIMGCVGLRAALQEHLGIAPGQTTPDGRFTLLPTVCLGSCDRAPVLAVDDDLYPAPNAESLSSILDAYE
jgi:NADH-quinone oxidoreductase subunit E